MRWVCFAAAAALAASLVPVDARASVTPADMRIAFVPLDDRPATELFPQRIAAICGVRLEIPPQETLGHFERPGDTEAISRWLASRDDRGMTALVISTDMLAYGGLVASRTPATPLGDALYRLRALSEFHRSHPDVPIYAFGTMMRLAPTATPQTEPYLDALTHYAQSGFAPDATDAQRAALAISRSDIPDGVFWDYMGSRARDLDVDEALLAMASDGVFAALALTQDDAGSATGLQVPEEARLRALVESLHLGGRVLLNPGADEMGMVMVMRAVEDAAGWAPSVAIEYPSEPAAASSDRLEEMPIETTIADLAAFLDMPVRTDADFELDTIAPDTDPAATASLVARIEARLTSGAPTAIADLTFLSDDDAAQRQTVDALAAAGLATKPIAYASWNTTANSAGTALAEASATLIGRHFDTLDDDAAATFLFERYVDDYGYRLIVRPELQAQLQAQGDDIYALGGAAAEAESQARSSLWRAALDIFDEDFKPEGWAQREITIQLPWQRTFEVRIDADLVR
jgi:hypothetical protein